MSSFYRSLPHKGYTVETSLEGVLIFRAESKEEKKLGNRVQKSVVPKEIQEKLMEEVRNAYKTGKLTTKPNFMKEEEGKRKRAQSPLGLSPRSPRKSSVLGCMRSPRKS
jgi:hypothetical protein